MVARTRCRSKCRFSRGAKRWIDKYAAGKPEKIAVSRADGVAPSGHVGYGLTFGVICSEWYPFGTAADITRLGRRAFPLYPLSVLAQAPQFTYMRDDCAVWNIRPATATIRQAVRSRIPTLIMSGSFDSVTSGTWARMAARTLSNARIVVFPGIGHDVAGGSACAREVMLSFLAASNRPNLACVAVIEAPAFATAR